MIEGSGSVTLTNGSGLRRPKKIRILRIRIQILNTSHHLLFKVHPPPYSALSSLFPSTFSISPQLSTPLFQHTLFFRPSPPFFSPLSLLCSNYILYLFLFNFFPYTFSDDFPWLRYSFSAALSFIYFPDHSLSYCFLPFFPPSCVLFSYVSPLPGADPRSLLVG
jgi:hypothetical protein